MADTQITHLASRQIHSLSNGEKQRMLLARALLAQPQLLILDEPTQNLDVNAQLAFYKLLDQIYRQGQTSVVMVSHDLHIVMADTKKVVCLFHHVCCSGQPDVVAKHPKFIEIFGADVGQAYAVYQHSNQHKCAHTQDNL